MRSITSRQNPVVRAFRELAATSDAADQRVLLDGAHLVHDARDAGLQFETVAVAAPRLAVPGEARDLATRLDADGIDVVQVPESVLRAMSPVPSPSGIVAIARRTPHRAADICGRDRAFVVVVAGVQDPGNLGSLLRASEAGGATGALVCEGGANPFSWKAIRGSMGSALRLPVAAGLSAQAALDCLRHAGAHTVAAVARGGLDPDAVRWSGRCGLLLGGEGHGLEGAIAARCDEQVTIPMARGVESMNVAVAAGILVYAARRRRGGGEEDGRR